jgi:hypothetical protein
MTCMKQEFCIHEKYCQRHIGQNFDSCILFSRNSKPQTNEEWFCQLSTEEKAKFLFEHGVICCQFCKGDCIEIDYKTKECKYNVSPTYSYTGIIKWLKEKHHAN